MTPKNKTKEELIKDIKFPQKRIAEFEAVDIKRKQVEKVLRESEKYFQLIFDNFKDGIIGIDVITRKFLFGNQAICRMLGYTLEELMVLGIKDIHPQKDFPAVMEEFDKQMRGELEIALGIPVQRKDGSIFYADINSFLLNVWSKTCLVGVFRDITERKQAEGALTRSENLLQKIFDILPIGLWFADKEGKLLRGNSMGIKIWGAEPKVSLSELGVFKARRLPSGAEIGPDDWALAHTIRDGVTIVDELLEIDAFDGNKKVILNYTAPVLDDQGKIQGAIVVNQDITERKKMENLLQKQQEEQGIILDSVPAWIFYKDTENRYIRVNKVFAEVMGMSKKQLEGKSMFDLHPKEQAETYWKDDKEVMASGKPKRNIIEPMETKKKSLWVQTDKIPYRDAQGNIIGIIGFAIDITERKKVETELKESHEQLRVLARHLQKERETERARIAKELHDELGQTLTAIKIDYACLQKKLGFLQNPLGEEVKNLSGLIDTTINTVRKLTMDLRPVMLDDLGLIPAIEWMIKGVQKRSGIKSELTVKPVHLKLGSDLSLTVFRIIQEALTNVIRYAQATRVQIVLEKRSDGLNLTIKDNGIGIHQKQIKNPYSLGLVGMRERVISHDGKVEITGEKNKGTMITVFFSPLKKGKSENTDS